MIKQEPKVYLKHFPVFRMAYEVVVRSKMLIYLLFLLLNLCEWLFRRGLPLHTYWFYNWRLTLQVLVRLQDRNLLFPCLPKITHFQKGVFEENWSWLKYNFLRRVQTVSLWNFPYLQASNLNLNYPERALPLFKSNSSLVLSSSQKSFHF